MHKFSRCLITEWRRLAQPAAGKTLVLGVSGGADSVSLLLGLHDLVERQKLEHRLVAAHFNHKLRDGESDADEQSVRELTGRLNIELAVGSAELSAIAGNVEQNARNARYRFLTETARRVGGYAILTGHTVNDQAETFLLNLLRGSGVTGLSGMSAVREVGAWGSEGVGAKGSSPDDGHHQEDFSSTPPPPDSPAPLLPFSPTPLLLVRPLLTWAKRLDTEGFCRDMDLEYRYDTMNEDTAFKRVRIRKILLPLLEDMNPNIIEVLSNTASLMQRFCDDPRPRNYLADLVEIPLSEIRLLPHADLRDLVRAWLTARRGNSRALALKHIEGVERLILSTKSGRVTELPGGRVVKSGGKLVYEKNGQAV